MGEDYWDQEAGGLEAGPEDLRAHERARLDRQTRAARRLLDSHAVWLVYAALTSLVTAGLLALAARTGHVGTASFLPDWLEFALPLVFGLAGLIGIVRFEASVRVYELVNAPYYRNRSRPWSPEMNALAANLLFAAVGSAWFLATVIRALL